MEETKRKKQKQVLLILLGLLLLLSGWLVYRYYLQAKPEPVTIVSGEFLPAGKDAQKISDSEKKKMAQVAVDKSKFNLVISPEAKIDRQTGSGELMIKNPSENGYPINVEIREKRTINLFILPVRFSPGMK